MRSYPFNSEIPEYQPFACYNVRYIEGADMLTAKVTTVGSSSGIILNREVMTRLGVRKGDVLYLTEAPDGGYRITPYNPEFERQMKLAEEIMHDDREILRALAK
jgi:putative addiction module antidote